MARKPRRPGRRQERLPAECRFDYTKARPNRFAVPRAASLCQIVLDADVAKVFTTAESVNAVLRALIRTMPAR